MTRIAMIATLFITALSLGPRPAQAAEGRWCAVASIGQGAVREDCQYATIEACQRAAAADRGTCNQNPRWSGSDNSMKKPKKR
jgi:hypothetical protein